MLWHRIWADYIPEVSLLYAWVPLPLNRKKTEKEKFEYNSEIWNRLVV